MNGWLLLAMVLVIGIGVAHSLLGEALILRPLFAHLERSGATLRLSARFTQRVLRFAWHVTTLAWWGLALVLSVYAYPTSVEPRAAVLAIVAATLGITAGVIAISSRGAHFAWILFALASASTLLGAWGLSALRLMGLPAIASAVVALVLFALALLHVYWLFGGKTGLARSVPHVESGANAGAPVFRPGPLSTIAVAVALASLATLTLHSATVLALPWPRSVSRILVAIGALLFTLRMIGDFRYVGVFKRVSSTSFGRWDTKLYTPLCFGLALGLAVTIL